MPLVSMNPATGRAVKTFEPHGQREIERRFNVKARDLFGMTEIGPGLAMPMGCDDMTGAGSVGSPVCQRRRSKW